MPTSGGASPYNKKIEKILASGGVGVLPTDTIYGIVGSALTPKTVGRIYALRKRNLKKPMIVLIGSIVDLKRFGVVVDAKTEKILARLWPRHRRGYGRQAGKVSIVLPCFSRKFVYLHRGTGTLAFRLPAKSSLKRFLRRTGPLVAPSANPEGEPPAMTIKEAKKYFKDKIDFYADAGRLASKPSTLVEVRKGAVAVLREGAVRI